MLSAYRNTAHVVAGLCLLSGAAVIALGVPLIVAVVLMAAGAGLFLASWSLTQNSLPSIELGSVSYPVGLALTGMAAPLAGLAHFIDGGRGVVFLGLVAVCWGGIALQAFSPRGRSHPGPILAEILGISLIVSLSGRVVPGMYHGYADMAEFEALTENLMRTGQISVERIYADFPTWHVMTAVISTVTDLPVHRAATVALSGFSLTFLLASYSIARLAIGDSRLALLSTLLVAAFADTVYFATLLTATVVGAGLALPLIALQLQPVHGPRKTVVTIVVTVLLIVSHLLSSFIYLFILLLFVVGSRLSARESTARFSLNLGLTTAVLLVAYLAYSASGAFEQVVRLAQTALTTPLLPSLNSAVPAAPPTVEGALPYAVLSTIARLPHLALGVLFLVGASVLLFSKQRLAGAAALVLPGSLVFGASLLVYVPVVLGYVVIFERWRYFAVPMAAIVGVIGLVSIPLGKARAGLCIAVLVGITVSSNVVAFVESDVVVGLNFGKPHPSYTSQEWAAIQHVLDEDTYPLATDYITSRVLSYAVPANAEISGTLELASNPPTGWYQLIRTDELYDRGLRFAEIGLSGISRDVLVTEEGHADWIAEGHWIVLDSGAATLGWIPE